LLVDDEPKENEKEIEAPSEKQTNKAWIISTKGLPEFLLKKLTENFCKAIIG